MSKNDLLRVFGISILGLVGGLLAFCFVMVAQGKAPFLLSISLDQWVFSILVAYPLSFLLYGLILFMQKSVIKQERGDRIDGRHRKSDQNIKTKT
jgi:hypothetical protein